MIDLSVIVISYNTKEFLKKCIDDIQAYSEGISKEIIVVDNNSQDGSSTMIKDNFPSVKLIENKVNYGFARANIQGFKIAQGQKYILLINSDAFVQKTTIPDTIKFIEEHKEYGILGCRIVNLNGALQPSARFFPTPWKLFVSNVGLDNKFPGIKFFKSMDDMRWAHDAVREADWIPGCYFLIRKTVIDDVGFFDPDYYLYYEEIDFCLRAKRKGWKVVFYPWAEVLHLGGESAKTKGRVVLGSNQLEPLRLESEYLYFRKNLGLIYVVLDFLFILSAHIINIGAKAIIKHKDLDIRNRCRHIKLALRVLIDTRFGAVPKN